MAWPRGNVYSESERELSLLDEPIGRDGVRIYEGDGASQSTLGL